jgi:hypothetical protein
MSGRLVAAVLAAGFAGAVAGCHEPEQPPVPPRPTDPTNGALAYRSLDVIDASIVSEAGAGVDAAMGRMDVSAAAAAEPHGALSR